MTRNQKIYRVTLTGSIVNMVLLVLKFVAGILGNSAAMIADAVHSLSDFLTDIVVIVLVKLSSKPADKDHDYGHGKYETIATSIIGMALVVVAIMLGWNGLEKIIAVINGEKIESPEMIALVAAIVSILLKEWVFRVTKKVALEVNSQALEANAWHRGYDNVVNATIMRVSFSNGEYWYRIAFKRGIQNAEENVQEAILDHYIIN